MLQSTRSRRLSTACCICRRGRLQPTEAFATLAPDWLCETLSPSTAKLDRTKKLGVYAREGVPHVWFVEPRRQTLEVFALRGSSLVKQATYHSRDRVRVEPFDAVEIELAVLWGERPAPSGSPEK